MWTTVFLHLFYNLKDVLYRGHDSVVIVGEKKVRNLVIVRKSGPLSSLRFSQVPQGFWYPKVWGDPLYSSSLWLPFFCSDLCLWIHSKTYGSFCSVPSFNRRFVGTIELYRALRVKSFVTTASLSSFYPKDLGRSGMLSLPSKEPPICHLLCFGWINFLLSGLFIFFSFSKHQIPLLLYLRYF